MDAHQPRSLLVTGGAGFIGSNFVHLLVRERSDVRVVVLDKLTYAGNLENLMTAEGKYTFVRGDISNQELVSHVIRQYNIDGIINFAAESHVDRSILGPKVFVETNVQGTLSLLEAAREAKIKRFLQVSTDEVYGSLGPTGYFTEETPLQPNSPYSASKASADTLVRAYHHTFGMEVLTTRCSNNYGPYQFPEKLIPLMIANALADKPLPIYGDGKNVRDWLHVEDHCRALLVVLERGSAGETYNIGGHNEWTNIEIVRTILRALSKPESLIKYVTDRPGHDRRYAIDAAKIDKELDWRPKHTFETGIKQTVDWYLENKGWWQRILSGEYSKYYAQQYGDR
jgi:dTDP-glucose 4,6-dehydratase